LNNKKRIIGIGTALFGIGFRKEIITPTSDAAYGTIRGSTHQLLESYPKFNAFSYSLETFVPLVKLGFGDHWTPNAKRGQSLRLGIVSFPRTGGWLRGYLWFHIIAGWVLTTLWVGGLAGLVKT
jgi:thiosulfate reductase cytochrome b subunit